jgi:hypothetical protein
MGAAPRILASVRLGRIGFRPLPGEPKKGFRPPRGSARARLVREPGARGEASATGNGGAASPGAVSFFGTAACRVQAATARSSDRRMGRPRVSSPARVGGAGPAAHGRCVGAERSLVSIWRLVFGCFAVGITWLRARVRRGNEKDLEGEQSPWKDRVLHGRQRSAARPNSTAEQRLEVDVVVSRSSRGCAGNGALLRVERGHRQRQGGNGHGDVVRLLARIPSGGVKCAARTMSVLPPGSGVGFGRCRGEVRESGYPKRSEPHDRQRDATSPRPPSGGNRRGGAKPRGRNRTPEMVSLEPKQAATPAGVDARWQLEQRRRFGGVSVEGEGCASGRAAKAVQRGQHRRIPREEVERESDPGSR